MAKFDMVEHEKRMRELLKPQSQVTDLATKFKDFTEKRKAGVTPPVIKQEI